MTLIEVVAGLALLATVLSATLTVRARCARQARLTEHRREAIHAADALIASWWQDAVAVPRHDSGTLAGPSMLAWRTIPVRNSQAEALESQVIRLEVLDRPGTSAGNDVLAAVELVIPAEKKNDTGVHPD